MNEQTLSKRLELVASFVPDGARIADIGTDHAYLPVNLALKGKIKFAIASDVVQGPYQSAANQIALSKVGDKVEARLASGLASIKEEDKIDTVTICGMGGALIAEILEEGYAKKHLSGDELLILQPNVSAQSIRLWFNNHGYTLLAEEILEENEKIYEILVAKKQETSHKLNKDELMFGPILMQNPSPAFRKKWSQEFEKNEYIIHQLKNVTLDQSEKIAEFQEMNKKIRELLEQ